MFYYLSGTVALLDAGVAVIDCGGVGYAVHTSTYSQAQMKQGQLCKVFTHCNIREDAFDIYGFTTREELGCFRLMLGVTGVGAKAALGILSAHHTGAERQARRRRARLLRRQRRGGARAEPVRRRGVRGRGGSGRSGLQPVGDRRCAARRRHIAAGGGDRPLRAAQSRQSVRRRHVEH